MRVFLDANVLFSAACREKGSVRAFFALAAAAGLPPKDAPILAAAVESRCHILATGDRTDFGRLMGRRMRGTVVMMPAEAIGLLLG